MKKFIIALLLGLFASSVAFADASFTTTKNGRAVSGQQGISNVVAQADGSTGYTQRVDSTGAAMVMKKPTSIATVAGTDAIAVTGAARVYGICAAGTSMAAGDVINIYDALSATGTPKYEISVGTAKGTICIRAEGANFATGVFVDELTVNNSLVTIEYQQ
jgi:hypothetical protein